MVLNMKLPIVSIGIMQIFRFHNIILDSMMIMHIIYTLVMLFFCDWSISIDISVAAIWIDTKSYDSLVLDLLWFYRIVTVNVSPQ